MSIPEETVNTDANLYKLMNNGQAYTGYGRALFPSHPEDLQPLSDCCMMPPCISRPPCPSNNNNNNNYNKPSQNFRFEQVNKEQHLDKNELIVNQFNDEIKDNNNNLRQTLQEKNVLYLPPPKVYNIPYYNMAQKNGYFI